MVEMFTFDGCIRFWQARPTPLVYTFQVPQNGVKVARSAILNIFCSMYSYIPRDFDSRFDPPLCLLALFLFFQKDFRLYN